MVHHEWGRNFGEKLGVFAPPVKFRGPIEKYVTNSFLVQPGAQQLVYIRRCSARPVRQERRVSDKFLTCALWGTLCAIGSQSWGERTCTIFGVVVHLPSVLDKFVLDFRSSAARRNYVDPKTSGVGISAKNCQKLGGFAPL